MLRTVQSKKKDHEMFLRLADSPASPRIMGSPAVSPRAGSPAVPKRVVRRAAAASAHSALSLPAADSVLLRRSVAPGFPLVKCFVQREAGGKRYVVCSTDQKLRIMEATAASHWRPGDFLFHASESGQLLGGVQRTKKGRSIVFRDGTSAKDDASTMLCDITHEDFDAAPSITTVLAPVLNDDMVPCDVPLRGDGRTYKVVTLKSKQPVWNEYKARFELNFGDTGTVRSVKNFQLVFPARSEVEVVLQFGKVAANTFVMQFRCPLTIPQALGIVLARITRI